MVYPDVFLKGRCAVGKKGSSNSPLDQEHLGIMKGNCNNGVIPGGGAGGLWPPNFWPTTLFSGFSHTTARKVPSEVVLMGSYVSHI